MGYGLLLIGFLITVRLPLGMSMQPSNGIRVSAIGEE